MNMCDRLLKHGGIVLAAATVAACENAGSTLGFERNGTGTISVLAYLDRDGTKSPSPLDTVFVGARASLLPKGGESPVRSVLTDGVGQAKFERIPLGEYRVRIEPTSLGDSVVVAAVDSAVARLVATDTLEGVLVRLAFPEVSIRQARTAPLGKRVFLRGVLLSSVQDFRDTTVHLSDTSGFLRLTRAALLGGAAGNVPGDSVTVIGSVATRSGQPTADLARIARLVPRPPPVPVPVSTATAARADVGRLDAALVLVTAATIGDTATVAPDFSVQITDGSGTLEMVLDATLNVARSVFRPGRTLNVRGVLVPTGTGTWVLKPRTPGDIVLN